MITKGEIADRYTILLIKQSVGLDVAQELATYAEAIAGIPPEIIPQLKQANRVIWAIEDAAKFMEAEEPIPSQALGVLYTLARAWNKRRVALKNAVNEQAGDPIDPRTQY